MCHERQSLDPRLGDEHTVERISVMWRQLAGLLSMLESDRQLLEAAIEHAGLERVRQAESSETELDRGFPGRGRTDPHEVRGADGSARALGQKRAVLALIQGLGDAEPDTGVKVAIGDALLRITGFAGRGHHPDLWREWWEDYQHKYPPKPSRLCTSESSKWSSSSLLH